MAQSRESSVLFSLRSLMDIERDRVHADERERVAHLERERREREEQRRLELEAERQRIALEEQRRAREQAQREREAARAVADKEAAITRARIEAQARAQLQALEKEREHEARMAVIGDTMRRRRDRVILIGSNSVLAAFLAIGLGIYVGKVAPEMEQREAQLRQLIAAEGERATVAERLARQSDEHAEQLQEELARTSGRLDEAEAKLRESRKEEVDVPPEQGRVGRGSRPAEPVSPAAPRCNDRDPLCGLQ
jgi:colicin import membrane protein